MVDEARSQVEGTDAAVAAERDDELAVALSELRLIKDEWEIEQMRLACAATAEGFDADIAAASPRRWRRAAASAGSRAGSGSSRATRATASATTASWRPVTTPARCTGSATTATYATAT